MRAYLLAVMILGCSGSSSPQATVDDVAASDETLAGDDTGATTTDGETTDTTPGADTGAPADTMTIPDAVATGGCGKAATAGVSNLEIAVGGAMRKYVLSIPTGYDPSKPYLLAFGWHGRTGNGALFKLYSGVEKASANKAIFVYPDGLPVTSDPKDTGWELTEKGRDIALYDALLKELTSTLCVDSKRVVSFGHSFGGYMSNTVGCFRSSVTRAIAPFAGGGPYGACGSAVSAWVAHATDDAVVMLSEGQKSRDVWLKKAGCNTMTTKVAPDPCVSYGGCTVPVIWCQAATGGHSWPSYAAAGIWNYFAAL